MHAPCSPVTARWLPWGVALVAAVVFFTNLGGPLLFDEDEPKNAVCGREMLERGDWVVPTFNAQLRVDKPILIYWVMLVSYSLFGVNEFAARLGSSLAGVGSVVMTYHLGRLLLDRWAGALGATLLASGLMFAALSRASTPDALLICCTTAAFLAFVSGISRLRGGSFSGDGSALLRLSETPLPRVSWIAMYAAMGMAVLAKGPVGVVLPLFVIGLWASLVDIDPSSRTPVGLWRGVLHGLGRRLAPARLLRILLSLRVLPGALIVLTIALPWYVAVGLRTDGAWLAGFLGGHNVGRFMQPMENHRGPVIYYLVAIMVGFFPGSVFLPASITSSVLRVRGADPQRPSLGFLLCWIGGYVGFFTLAATKLPNYVTPCYPAVALVTGCWLVRACRLELPPLRRLRVGFSAFGIAGLAVGVGLIVLASTLLKADPWIGLPAVSAMFASTAALVMLYRNNRPRAMACFATGCVLFTTATVSFSAYRASPYQEGPRLAERIAAFEAGAPEPTRVALCGYFTPNLVFYLGRPVEQIGADAIADYLAGPSPGVVLVPGDVFEQIEPNLPEGATVVAEEKRFLRRNGRVVMLSKSPAIVAAAQSEAVIR
ncbi:Undecaprenyl phosphate-alpha-4-amino-4-deoxy-L-arabinose arabinosyl transferase [Pirellulimonas nuda]|uniref:Undecaprenyl phosphate-alpha-4-amino-4-deoxy-L-arabinose arabinosyl transferase n=1 Tax=Pirellulimonas nuda TaxID=2528009 RepID=A0A518D8D1_9BACT|nr:glycosyltransferase family 39 protein [Pirellulimonas nuda]QDU87710.1 Undecaprenyl phosphate-alpha-4-amino-4-deoxy-L-arabinose arabinosyl transferase [Pirellulimonas nuda]